MSTRGMICFHWAPEAGPGSDLGQLAGMLYQHSDSYWEGECGVFNRLKYLQKVLAKTNSMYGARLDDAEYAAAEYLVQYRKPHDAPEPKEKWLSENIAGKGTPHKHCGGLYVAAEVHGDVDYKYIVVCKPQGWDIHIYRPVYASGEITGWNEVPQAEISKREREEKARVRQWEKENKRTAGAA